MTDFLLKASLGEAVQGQMNADQGQLRVLCLRDEYRSALIMTYELLIALELYTRISRLPFKAIYSQLTIRHYTINVYYFQALIK